MEKAGVASPEARGETKMKAIVFCQFPMNFFHDKLQPELEKHGVETIRVLNAEKNTTADFSDADIVITFIDMMGHALSNRVRKQAKTYGKRFVALTRKSASWGTDLGTVVKEETKVLAKKAEAEVRRAPPPAPLRVVAPLPVVQVVPEPESAPDSLEEGISAEDQAELVRMFEEDNASLDRQLQEARRVIVGLQEVIEENAKLPKATTALPSAQEVRRLNELNTQFNELNAQNVEQATLIKQLRLDNVALKEEMTKLKQRPTVRNVDDLTEAIKAFKVLLNMGILSVDEFVEKILNYKPKDR